MNTWVRDQKPFELEMATRQKSSVLMSRALKHVFYLSQFLKTVHTSSAFMQRRIKKKLFRVTSYLLFLWWTLTNSLHGSVVLWRWIQLIYWTMRKRNSKVWTRKQQVVYIIIVLTQECRNELWSYELWARAMDYEIWLVTKYIILW